MQIAGQQLCKLRSATQTLCVFVLPDRFIRVFLGFATCHVFAKGFITKSKNASQLHNLHCKDVNPSSCKATHEARHYIHPHSYAICSMQGSRRQASGAELVTSDMPSYLLGAARHWQFTLISDPGITVLQMHRVLLRNMCHVSNGQRPASSCDNPACPSSRPRLTVRNRGCCKLGLLLMPQDTDCT